MNVLCPTCQKQFAVADQQAGQTTSCPVCGFAFTAPALAAAGASGGPQAPPPIPPLEATPNANEPPILTSPAAGSAWSGGPGYQHRRTLWFSPRIVPGIAPLFLAVVFVLWFFPWVVLPAQETVVTANAWELAFGSPVSLLLMFAMLLLLPALAASWAALAISRKLIQVRLPPAVESVWPMRFFLIGGVVAVALAFVVLQLLTGFGREAALDANNVYAPLAHRTLWLWIAVKCHILALVGAWLEHWLGRRGDRPWPRIDFSW